jgi:hypothetical protein
MKALRWFFVLFINLSMSEFQGDLISSTQMCSTLHQSATPRILSFSIKFVTTHSNLEPNFSVICYNHNLIMISCGDATVLNDSSSSEISSGISEVLLQVNVDASDQRFKRLCVQSSVEVLEIIFSPKTDTLVPSFSPSSLSVPSLSPTSVIPPSLSGRISAKNSANLVEVIVPILILAFAIPIVIIFVYFEYHLDICKAPRYVSQKIPSISHHHSAKRWALKTNFP